MSGGRVRPSTEQPPYSILCRGVEHAVFPTCRRYDVGALVWAPLNGGWLTGKYRRDHGRPPCVAGRAASPTTSTSAAAGASASSTWWTACQRSPDGAGLSLTALAIGFVLAHPAVSAVLLGPRTPDQLADLLTHADVRLDPDVLAAIDAVVPPGTTSTPGTPATTTLRCTRPGSEPDVSVRPLAGPDGMPLTPPFLLAAAALAIGHAPDRSATPCASSVAIVNLTDAPVTADLIDGPVEIAPGVRVTGVVARSCAPREVLVRVHQDDDTWNEHGPGAVHVLRYHRPSS